MDTQTRHALKQDNFVNATTSGIGWLEENRTAVIRGSIVIVVILGLFFAGLITWNNRQAKAQAAFGEAMSIYQTPLAQPGEPAQPGEKTYASAAERARAANPIFVQVADNYSWFKEGANARYFAGLTYMTMGENSQAETELKKAADAHDSGLAALAKMALAGLYQQTGRTQQAIDEYKQLIANPAVTVPASAAKLQLAALYEGTNPAEAKRLYAEIKDQDKTGAAGQIATQKLQGGAAPRQ